MEKKYYIKVSDGKHVFIENVSDQITSGGYNPKTAKFKEIEILEMKQSEFIFIWYNNFCERKNLPKWVFIANELIFELICY